VVEFPYFIFKHTHTHAHKTYTHTKLIQFSKERKRKRERKRKEIRFFKMKCEFYSILHIQYICICMHVYVCIEY